MNQTKATHVVWHSAQVARSQRWQALGQQGATLWFTGLSGSGKSTVATALEAELVNRAVRAYRLDGDNIRHGLNRDLGFSPAERQENIRRIGEVARLFADSGCIVLTSFISPYRADRQQVRALHSDWQLPFAEVHVDSPLAVCEQRDPKGLYKRARAGEIQQFTGIDAPYEPPPAPELYLQTERQSVREAVQQCMAWLNTTGIIDTEAGAGAKREVVGQQDGPL